MPRRIESHFISGPTGRLEALLEEPEEGEPGFCAVVCHPHPQHGGTMHNKVVFRLARGLRRAGAVVLRFNYRGVGGSEGGYGDFLGEVEDARAAVVWLRRRCASLGIALAGFSFGARIVTQLGCELEDAGFLMAAGFPTGTRLGKAPLERCHVPKIFIQSTHDEYGPQRELQSAFAEFSEPKQLIWIEAADHFFGGALAELEEQVRQTAAEALVSGGSLR